MGEGGGLETWSVTLFELCHRRKELFYVYVSGEIIFTKVLDGIKINNIK